MWDNPETQYLSAYGELSMNLVAAGGKLFSSHLNVNIQNHILSIFSNPFPTLKTHIEEKFVQKYIYSLNKVWKYVWRNRKMYILDAVVHTMLLWYFVLKLSMNQLWHICKYICKLRERRKTFIHPQCHVYLFSINKAKGTVRLLESINQRLQVKEK